MSVGTDDWSNADEVVDFIDQHRNRKYEVGEMFVLPDNDQTYQVIAVRPIKRNGDFSLFLDLETECAVEGCEAMFIVPVEVHRWRKGRYLTRCCPEHYRKYATTMPYAWKTRAERAVLIEQEKLREDRAAQVARVVKDTPRTGPFQDCVLDAARVLGYATPGTIELLGPSAEEKVVQLAIRAWPKPRGRDTRRQRIVRAIAQLQKRDLL